MIYCHSSEHMHETPDESIDLIITSPPYNVGVPYDVHDDNLSFDNHRQLLKRVWKECYTVLKPAGRMCINVGNTGYHPYIPLASYIAIDMLEIGFLMRGEIIWDKTVGRKRYTTFGSWLSPSNPNIREGHEHILCFSKMQYQRQPPQETMSKQEFKNCTESIWRVQPVINDRDDHPAPFPVELPRRLIKLYSYEGDRVLDPFMGSGTTLVAAKELNRHGIGYEISPEYVKIAKERLRQEYLL